MDLESIRKVKVSGVCHYDFPELVDAFIEEAYWTSGDALTEYELGLLNKAHPEFVNKHAIASLMED